MDTSRTADPPGESASKYDVHDDALSDYSIRQRQIQAASRVLAIPEHRRRRAKIN